MDNEFSELPPDVLDKIAEAIAAGKLPLLKAFLEEHDEVTWVDAFKENE